MDHDWAIIFLPLPDEVGGLLQIPIKKIKPTTTYYVGQSIRDFKEKIVSELKNIHIDNNDFNIYIFDISSSKIIQHLDDDDYIIEQGSSLFIEATCVYNSDYMHLRFTTYDADKKSAEAVISGGTFII